MPSPRWTLLLVTLCAFGLRAINLDGQSLWRDEVDTLLFATASLTELLSGLFRVGHNGPLYFILMRPWLELVGASEFALRYPSALMGTLAIPLGYILARQFRFNPQNSLIFTLLLATSPYLVWYGQEAKMYAALVVLIQLGLITHQRALETNRPRWWIAFVAMTSLSFYTHILAPLMLPVYAVMAYITLSTAAECDCSSSRQQKQQLKQLHSKKIYIKTTARRWLISMACLTLPYLPLALWQAPILLAGGDSGHRYYPLIEQISLMLQLYINGLVQTHGQIPLTLSLFLLLCGLFLPTTNLSRQRLIIGLWLILPTLTIHLISRRIPIFEDRYLIYITPALYLLVVMGLLGLRQYSRFLAMVCLAGILSFNLVGVWRHQSQPIKADMRAAAAYVQHQATPPTTVMMQIPYLQHTLRYYYPADQYTLLEGLWTNDGRSAISVDRTMREMTACLSELWLLVSEENLWDEQGLTRGWLDQNSQLIDQAEFNRVTVYRYRFGEVGQTIPPTHRYRVYLPLVQSGACETK